MKISASHNKVGTAINLKNFICISYWISLSHLKGFFKGFLDNTIFYEPSRKAVYLHLLTDICNSFSMSKFLSFLTIFKGGFVLNFIILNCVF